MTWKTTNEDYKADEKNNGRNGSSLCSNKKNIVIWFILFLISTSVVYYFVIINKSKMISNNETNKDSFQQKLKQICSSKTGRPLEYKGVDKFFEYIYNPNDNLCSSWVEFGGEKHIVLGQGAGECQDEIRRNKYICFNKEFEMTKDPCLVYSFGRDMDSQFERDMNMFSCEVHTFDFQAVSEADHIQRSNFRFEHAYDISDSPYDLPYEGGSIKRRDLKYIVDRLGHRGKEIKFIKSDLKGREWILLREIIANQDIVDIKQIGIQIHISLKVNNMTGQDRDQYFRQLFQVFQGLDCAGYEFIQSRYISYYAGRIKIPESNKQYYQAYELNFAKFN